MPFCTKCGTEVPIDASFCTKCGNKLQFEQSSTPSLISQKAQEMIDKFRAKHEKQVEEDNNVPFFERILTTFAIIGWIKHIVFLIAIGVFSFCAFDIYQPLEELRLFATKKDLKMIQEGFQLFCGLAIFSLLGYLIYFLVKYYERWVNHYVDD